VPGGQPAAPLWDPAGGGSGSSSGFPLKIVLIAAGAVIVVLAVLGGVVYALTSGGGGDDGTVALPTSTTAADEEPADDEPSDEEPADDEPSDEEPADDDDDGPTSAFPTAEVGECINNDFDGGTISQLDVVPCSEPHVGEAFHVFDLPEGDFPGQAALESAITEECTGSVFEDYVGEPYQTSAVYISPLTPTAQTWEQGDREVICFLVTEDGSPTTGSFEGSGL